MRIRTNEQARERLSYVAERNFPLLKCVIKRQYWDNAGCANYLAFFFFTKREIEALLADAGLTHFPEMLPNRQVRNYLCFP